MSGVSRSLTSGHAAASAEKQTSTVHDCTPERLASGAARTDPDVPFDGRV
jgi:hypothetical protein